MTTIICVDDDPRNSEKISQELTEEGYQVLLTIDGDEGLEMILEQMPQLILYNIATAHENRYRILTEVREKYPLMAETPFIFVSKKSDNEQVLSDLKAGADAYLTEPVNTTFLLATVKASLRQIDRIKFKHDRLLVLDI